MNVGIRSNLNAVKRHIDKRSKEKDERLIYEQYVTNRFISASDLGRSHFQTWSDTDHINRPGFDCALELMAGMPKTILETGTSAWGTDSTRLWDAYVSQFGGEFWSVDLSPTPSARLRHQVCAQTHLEIGDSVEFIQNFSKKTALSSVDVCYLDSWDLDWSDPDPAALHGLSEWNAVEPLMSKGSILIIDDSPSSMDWVPNQYREQAHAYEQSHGYLPGKGALVDLILRSDPRVEVIWHGYNSVYRFSDRIS